MSSVVSTCAVDPLPSTRATVRGGAFTVFLAALGPMLTVPALRRLLMDAHGTTPAGVHLFVALGMIGSAIGAPLVAARADRRRCPIRLAVILASVDALVAVISSSAVPTTLLFALRPVHGLASMGLLALLFAEFRRSSGQLVARAGGAMVAALAVGPAVGGALTRLGPEVPFRAAALVSGVVAVILMSGAAPSAEARGEMTAPARAPFGPQIRRLFAPLAVVMTQRFAIGGFVASFAVQARAVHGLSDARIGASFSLVLVVFGLGVFLLGRSRSGLGLLRGIPVGALVSGAAFVALAFAPRALLPVALAAAGLGLALVYAPCLDIVSAAAPSGRRATSMALLHSAGAVGMILGPIAAAVLDMTLRGWSAPQRGATFMALAGTLHALVAFTLASRCRVLSQASRQAT